MIARVIRLGNDLVATIYIPCVLRRVCTSRDMGGKHQGDSNSMWISRIFHVGANHDSMPREECVGVFLQEHMEKSQYCGYVNLLR